ncbi:MAG: hypothetical protein EOP46_12000 [Sphingobacteriaceae bacterium]|nr:MAG: hypothetical protein EOP46_12000 [Sphingobacteriaceae bacterium]
MSYLEFVEQLKSIEIPVEYYKEAGLNSEFIEEMIQRYNPPLKTCPMSFQYGDDEVIKLLKTYDAGKIEIGMVQFAPELAEVQNGIYIGKFEADELIIDKFSGEILCYEYGIDHLLWPCASNGSMFLRALAEVARFLEKRAQDDALYNNDELGYEVAKYCCKLAGGSKYCDFYTTMLT